jgi:hypothetical protein
MGTGGGPRLWNWCGHFTLASGLAFVLNVIFDLGHATKRLCPAFREIIGLDPSENMIKAAVANREFFTAPSASGHPPSQFQFRRGGAEDLKGAGIENESVDMVIAGQSEPFYSLILIFPALTNEYLRGYVFFGFLRYGPISTMLV